MFTYSGAQFVDNVRHVELGVELEVSGSVRHARAQPAGQGVELYPELTLGLAVKDFANQVLAEVGHVRDASLERVEDQGVGVRIHLTLRDGRLVVHRVVDAAILLRGGNHLLALARIVDVLDGSGELPSFLGERNDD